MINKTRRSAASLALALTLTLTAATALTGCAPQSSGGDEWADATKIALSDEQITVDGEAVTTADGSGDAEAPAVYASHDIIYYEDRDTYDSGNAYGEGGEKDKHSAEEAAAHTVVNITEAGTYHISGQLSKGQIAIDLGKDAKRDPNAVVTLVLDGADINCDVAPAVIFYNVYECDTAWVAYDEEETTDFEATSDVDTAAAGANVIIADGSVNNIDGAYVARIYKDNDQQKKLHKYDAAFYSKMSMNVTGGKTGDGVLNINADNEGLDTEQHLTINGGKINIASGDDGINTNEDGVSVTTINGGSLHIVAGLGEEGDGIDSNGWLVINGGTVIAAAKPMADSGLDSDMGSYINGGTVLATGSTMDWAESDSRQVTMNLQFAQRQGEGEAIVVTDEDGLVLFAYDPDQDETTGSNNRGYQGAVISSPNFAVGKTYNVYVGGDVRGTDVDGLFDPDTVTGFDGGVKQEYTGTDVGFGFPGGFGGGFPGGFGGQRPEGFEPPEGFDPGNFDPNNMPEGMELPEDFNPENFDPNNMPEGFDPGQFGQGGQRPGGMGKPGGNAPDGENGQRPEGAEGRQPGGQRPDGMGGQRPDTAGGSGDGQPKTASTKFYMNDKVNAFSGVCDEGTNAPESDEAPEEK